MVISAVVASGLHHRGWPIWRGVPAR